IRSAAFCLGNEDCETIQIPAVFNAITNKIQCFFKRLDFLTLNNLFKRKIDSKIFRGSNH
ncbi:unnamed protein product, partial [Schistosoma turkestanicum]